MQTRYFLQGHSHKVINRKYSKNVEPALLRVNIHNRILFMTHKIKFKAKQIGQNKTVQYRTVFADIKQNSICHFTLKKNIYSSVPYMKSPSMQLLFLGMVAG